MSQDKNLIQILVRRYLPYWPLFVSLITLAVGGAWFYLKHATPIYEVSATIIIKDEKKGVDDSEIMESINVFTSKKIVENEIEVIQSRDLMKRVVNELFLYTPIFEEKGLKPASAYVTSPILIELKNPDRKVKGIEDTMKVFFSFDSIKNVVKIKDQIYPVEKWIDSPYGEIRFLRNDKKESDAENLLFFKIENPKKVTDELLSKLSVSAPNKLSTVVNLKFKDPVPRRGEDILNRLIHSYNQAAINDRNNLAANTLAFIEDRMKQVKYDLDEVEREVQQYKSTEGVVDLSEQGKLYLHKVGDNDRQISDLNLQLAVLSKVEKYVISKDKDSGIVPSTLGLNDEVLSQLLKKLYDSELEYERLKKTTAENNPMLISISNEIAKIRPSILENVRSQKVNLQASLENLKSTSGQYNSALQSIPEKERQLLEISRREANKNELYSYLQKKREETALSYSPTAGESKIVDMAQSSINPVSPVATVIYAIAIMGALAVCASIVTAKEILDNKIENMSDIENYTKLPVVGELSYFKQRRYKKQNKELNQLVLEQMRDIRVALGLYGKNKHKKKILITSSIEGEGKSFISENIAKSLALSGKKVVLINFDLRKPNASQVFGAKANEGLTEYLTGALEIEQIIKQADLENLYIIPGGASVQNTSDVLLDLELEGLFNYLESNFDYVIIDTPPVGVALDAYLLSKYTDTIIYVVRHRYTHKKMLERLEQNQDLDELKEVGIIYNGVRKRQIEEGGYGLGKGYGNKYVIKEKELS